MKMKKCNIILQVLYITNDEYELAINEFEKGIECKKK